MDISDSKVYPSVRLQGSSIRKTTGVKFGGVLRRRKLLLKHLFDTNSYVS